jgi:NitT/TauT family transport system permease protein
LSFEEHDMSASATGGHDYAASPQSDPDSFEEAPLFIAPRTRLFEFRAQLSPAQTALFAIAGIAVFFLIWQLGHVFTAESNKKFFPSPLQVLTALYTLFAEKNFLADVIKSTYRVFASFALAALVAIPIGLTMGSFKSVRAMLGAIVSAWRYLPAASFIPLLLVWFGPNDTSKLALLFLGVIFFLIALIVDNTDAVPNEFIEAALTMGADRKTVLTEIVVPAAAPAILDSLRNMIAVCWTYLVIAEIVGAQDGIGAVMMRAGRFLNVDVIMAGILMIGILGVLTDILFRIGSRLILPWAYKR